jgi:hypothetical protein
MANVDGKWTTVVASPMGDQKGTLTLKSSGDALAGTWEYGGSSVAIQDGKIDGDNLSWKASVTTPFPMTLDCTATVTGDAMSGNVKAGSFGTFALTGTRT